MVTPCRVGPHSLNCVFNFCHYRALILLLAAGGIVLSVLASQTCEFLRFNVDGDSATNELDTEWPFDMASEGWIGIFQYEIVRDASGDVVSSGCTSYDQQFLKAPNRTLVASQFCAVLAPIFAFLAILLAVLEITCSFRWYGSFIATSILFLAAAATQGGTFSSFANPSFCFNAQCNVGTAVYFSASASLAFFLSCILLCCSPRPVPCCGMSRKSSEDEEAPPEAPVIDPPKISKTGQT